MVIPAGHSQLYMWDNPLLEWQLQWQVVGEGQDTWTTVEVSVCVEGREGQDTWTTVEVSGYVCRG